MGLGTATATASHAEMDGTLYVRALYRSGKMTHLGVDVKRMKSPTLRKLQQGIR